MARTIDEIKSAMTSDFMRNSDVARAYGFEPGATFSSCFSKVSIESLLFYIVACATWVVETLFDKHKADVEAEIEEIMPHRPKWYRDKALAFMKDKALVADTDHYATGDMSEAEIEAARVVKFAAATENEDASILTIKVAGGADGARSPLDQETAGQLEAYLAEVKDAGVRINLVNMPADTFYCEIIIYYDAMLLSENVEAACRTVIAGYVENLPFNGEYTNMALVDCLQTVEGVRIAELASAEVQIEGESTRTKIGVRYAPASGYFKVGGIKLRMTSYK